MKGEGNWSCSSMDPRRRLHSILSHLLSSEGQEGLRMERDCEAALQLSSVGAFQTGENPSVSDMPPQSALACGHQDGVINSREEGRVALSSSSVTVSESSKDNIASPIRAVLPPPPSFGVRNCVFCNIVHGRSPAFKLYEDDICICILDVHPLSHGHALIVPKSHFPSLELTPPEVAASMCSIVPLISQAILEATNSESFNLLVNNGAAAGQVIFHTHFHIIPRRFGDNLWTSEGSCRRALSNDGETIHFVEQIRHKLSDAKIS